MPGLLDDATDDWGWRSNMDWQPKKKPPLLQEGPAPTLWDKTHDAIYGALGGTPDQRPTARAATNLLDVGSLGFLSGAHDGGQALGRGEGPAQLAMALLPGAKVAQPAVRAAEAGANALAREAPQGIRAYHGSPHDFDRFDLGKIGTGEGSQAFGHGLYFAGNEDVARTYKNLSPSLINGKPHDPTDPEHVAAEALHRAQQDEGDRYHAADMLNGMASKDPARQSAIEQAARLLSNGNDLSHLPRPMTSGRMYEVNIGANPNDFLDFDKPLSQQSDKVKAVIKKHPMAGDFARSNLTIGEPPLNASAAWGVIGKRERTNQYFKENGIPGIKYLDQGSRTSGDGSRNYVVFDDKLISILRKYGLLPPAAAAAMAGTQASQSPGDMQQ